jgi:hypothetical protein
MQAKNLAARNALQSGQRRFVPYKPGDLFYLRMLPMRIYKVKSGAKVVKQVKLKDSLQYRWTGPHQVITAINPVNYRALVDGEVKTVHARKMKPTDERSSRNIWTQHLRLWCPEVQEWTEELKEAELVHEAEVEEAMFEEEIQDHLAMERDGYIFEENTGLDTQCTEDEDVDSDDNGSVQYGSYGTTQETEDISMQQYQERLAQL